MGLSHAPHGLSSFGIPVIPGGNFPVTFGTFFFVNATGGVNANAPGNGTDPSHPFATIAYAMTQCVAGRGDIILVAPGHTESLSGAAAIAASVAGVSVIGLGYGSFRPLITWHTTDATIAISAANVMFANLRVTGDVDAVVKLFNITAPGWVIDAVDFVETAACAALQFLLTSAAADDGILQNCSHVQSQTAATALMEWFKLIGADRVKIKNNFVDLKGYATSNPANGVIVGGTTASLDVEISDNRFVILNSTGNVPISMLANSTGIARRNSVHSSKTAVAGSIALANMYGSENYASNTVNTAGFLDPVVDT